jgi:hypothetical protein
VNTRLFRPLGVIAFAATLVLLSSATATAQSGGMRDANFDGVSFRYDASLTGGIEPKLVPETVATADMPYWMAQPQHIEFNFSDFHGSSTQSLPPTIYVFPVRSEYASLTTGDQDFWLPTVQALRQLLTSQPDPQSLVAQLSKAPGSPPTIGVLPPVNAVSTVIGKLGYLSFRNGLGIRSLVQVAQDASPPDRDSTLYTFQGLTADGKYYVAAYFPAFPSAMQPIGLFQGSDIRAYYLNLIERFNGINNDAYTPNLDNVDKMIGSLDVHPTGLNVLPGMPSTGGDGEEATVIGLAALASLMICAGGLVYRRRRTFAG